MTRTLLKFALLFFFVFIACIGLIGARPVNQDELRAFLLPPAGCPPPCWQGIRPGITTADEAMAFLEIHPWISSAARQPNFYFDRIDSRIEVEWSGQQPAWIYGNSLGVIGIRDNVVRWVAFETTVPLGEMLLTLGRLPFDARYFYFSHLANDLTIGIPFFYRQRSRRILPAMYDITTGIAIGEVPQMAIGTAVARLDDPQLQSVPMQRLILGGITS